MALASLEDHRATMNWNWGTENISQGFDISNHITGPRSSAFGPRRTRAITAVSGGAVLNVKSFYCSLVLRNHRS